MNILRGHRQDGAPLASAVLAMTATYHHLSFNLEKGLPMAAEMSLWRRIVSRRAR